MVSKFAFEPWRESSFLHPLGLSFCMRSLKYSKFLGKLSKAAGADHKHEDLEKLTPEIFKMSFFVTTRTSPGLPPVLLVERFAFEANKLYESCPPPDRDQVDPDHVLLLACSFH